MLTALFKIDTVHLKVTYSKNLSKPLCNVTDENEELCCNYSFMIKAEMSRYNMDVNKVNSTNLILN